jgi:hypothetical protein
MKNTSKKALTALSASTLAAGMAHGAIQYNYLDSQAYANGNGILIDLDLDGIPDYDIGFAANNKEKPFISSQNEAINDPGLAYVLSDASSAGGSSSAGLPLTTNGTIIDASYESDQNIGYFYKDNSGSPGPYVVGGWNTSGTNVQGYVGLEFVDSASQTHFGWAQFIYNPTTVTNGNAGVLIIVDYAMETTPDTAIVAGQTAPPGLPSIFRAPVSQTNYPGATAQFNVVGIGNPNPTYQWMARPTGGGAYTNLIDGGTISGSTTTSLTISNIASGNVGDYIVVLSNSFGSVSNTTPANLSVVPLVIDGLTPSPVRIYSGLNASIQVHYGSSVPITSYQWLENGVGLSNGGRISGADSQNLVITGTTTADSGPYSVILSNSYGSVTSAVDQVTVSVPEAAYQKEAIALGAVSLYSFGETNDPSVGNVPTFDYIGGLNGVYGTNTQNGAALYNIVGPRPTDGFLGFTATNTAFQVGPVKNDTNSFVVIPPLNLNNNTLTITAWVYPTSTEPNYTVIVSYRSPVAGTANGLTYGPNATLGYHWNDQGSSYNFDSGLVPPVGQWSFVALVIQPTNTSWYLFNTNGQTNVTTFYQAGGTVPLTNSVQALNTPGNLGGDGTDFNFIGNLDEVGLFNYALTPDQLNLLYNVAVTGLPPVVLQVQSSGKNVILSWPQGILQQATNLLGPWVDNGAATSPSTNAATEGQMFYRVKVQ